MKLIFLIIPSIIGLTWSAPTASDEPPICNTVEHMEQTLFRNINDPTTYYACYDYNKPAELINCVSGRLFDETQGGCIEASLWKWSEPTNEFKSAPRVIKYTPGHDGRPGCKTDFEISRVYWRNNNDPTKYWKCEQKFQAAIEMACPHGYSYEASAKICIALDRWEWSDPVDPPTFA